MRRGESIDLPSTRIVHDMHLTGQDDCARYALAPSRVPVKSPGMSRKPKTKNPSPYKLREWRNAMGKTLEDVGTEIGMTGQNYGKIERGTVDLLPGHVENVAKVFGVTPADLMRDPSERPTSGSVAVVGFVGAGSVATLFAEGQGPFDMVDAPADARPQTVALEIQGASLGPAFDHGIVFYDDVRSPVTPDLHGRLCVVGLEDGRVLVKLLRAANDGTFHLFSNSMDDPMLNERVSWAARVKDVRPR